MNKYIEVGQYQVQSSTGTVYRYTVSLVNGKKKLIIKRDLPGVSAQSLANQYRDILEWPIRAMREVVSTSMQEAESLDALMVQDYGIPLKVDRTIRAFLDKNGDLSKANDPA